jgi:hypothetical protein
MMTFANEAGSGCVLSVLRTDAVTVLLKTCFGKSLSDKELAYKLRQKASILS